MECGRAPPLPGLEELWGAGIRGSQGIRARWEPSLGTEGLALRGTGFQQVSVREAWPRTWRSQIESQAEMPVSLQPFENHRRLHCLTRSVCAGSIRAIRSVGTVPAMSVTAARIKMTNKIVV